MEYQIRLNRAGVTLLEPLTQVKNKHLTQCNACGHIWTPTPLFITQTYKKHGTNGCPKCKEKRQKEKLDKIKNKNILEIESRGFTLLSPREHVERQNDIEVQNNECGHIFTVRMGNLLSRDVKCPVCNTKRKRKQFQQWNVERQEEYRKTASEWDIYRHNVYMSTRRSYNKYHKIINPKNLPQGRAGTEGAYHLDHKVAVRYCFENNIPVEICAHPQNLQMLRWERNITARNKLKEIPPIFYPYISSEHRANLFIKEVVKIFDETPEIHSLALDPYPLTIYYPSLSFGVLFCPLEDFKESETKKFYCRDILNHAKNIGIRLIQVFEDEWYEKKDLVLSKISHYANKSNNIRLYARNCRIQEITPDLKGKFLNQHHIQGNDNSTKWFGAFHENELVAVMTFAEPRIAVGGRNTSDIELVRFTTKTGYHVIGIASKLLKTFERQNPGKTIYSFADQRWSVGNLYEKIGFNKQTVNPPDYFYLVDGVRKHRWNYRKDKLREILPTFNPQKTEYQNMIEAGYDRVWGCGTIKYVKS